MSFPIMDSAQQGAGLGSALGGAMRPAPAPTPMGQGSAGPGLAYGGSSDAYQQALGLYGAYAEPQLGQLDSQDALLRSKQTGVLAGQDQTANALQSQYGIGVDRTALARQQTNIAMRNPQSDIDYWNGIQNLAQQYYGTQTGLFNQGRGIAKDWYGQQMDFINQARGLKGQESDINMADVLRNYMHQKFQFGSQQTGTGAWNTEGTQEGFGNLSSQRDIQQNLLRNQLAQTNLGLSREGAGAKHGLDTELLGFDSSQAGAYNQLQQDLLRGSHGTQQAQASLDALKLKGQEYGIDERELADKLQQGLSSLHLDTTMKLADLLGALSSNDFNKQQVANQVISQAIQATGYMPGASMGGGSTSAPSSSVHSGPFRAY